MSLGEEYKSKGDIVADRLREAIRNGEIVPGQYVRQDELAQKLGVSPTPVREALRRLEAEGVLVRVPNKGVRVKEISIEDAEELYLIRRLLECQITKMAVPKMSAADQKKLEKIHKQMEAAVASNRLKAVRKMNMDFHMTLWQAANTSRMAAMIQSSYPWDTLWVVPERAQLTLSEHAAILEAVQKGDADKASQLMAEHIDSASRSVTEYIRHNAPHRRGPDPR